MRRIALIVTLAVIAAACTSEAESPPLVTQTPSSSTAATEPTTTTTERILTVDGDNIDQGLTALVTSLYAVPTGGQPPAAPESVINGFQSASGVGTPYRAIGHVGTLDDDTRVAVVEAGNDVTLAIADPDWRVVGGWWPSQGVAMELGEFPKTIAVVGSDARPDEDRDHTRSDSIHFVTLDGQGDALLVGVPRDSWVPIHGSGKSKINSALSNGGPELMMQTFVDLTGATFDGYLLTGFAGFGDLIGVLGGLDIDVPFAINDKAAKASLSAGQQVLKAADALSFTRARKTLSNGDFGRSANGGLALIAAANTMTALGVGAIPGLIEQAQDMYSTDMAPEQLLTLAAAITLVRPDQTTNVVAAGSGGSAGGASVVFLSGGAYDTFADMTDGILGNQ
jgi:polyisoprenyl-teichoic acid--peptidoglycan teichoic acid transferase